MSDKEKEKSVEEFQNNPKIKLFIGNIISAGEGITLTTGDITMFNSLTYEPYLMEQAESREHRPGQKKTVTIYKMLFYNTISEKILADLVNKTDIINKVI
jgi:SNF2 family DNA or RNA helicase